ncbi:MAG: Asp-tRNA(Asn)/Glu-tRNA(Gln) amidotransferase subunit GatC [Candidatus Gracilibacteria bacterium]|nr:Asp-tRNA(Asn)/Glu-tRNA(Gln) amidotransferase subunit GatC [Candidatus Gracilibacteria bacterium]
MSLTQEQIEKLSKNLSKINVNSGKIANDINGILDYIELLNEVDTTGVIPTVSVIETENILREDFETNKNISRADLLACSNQKIIADQIAISNIMK